MNTELITQQRLECQVFISVFKVSDDNIIIKFDFIRQICLTQTNYEKHLFGVTDSFDFKGSPNQNHFIFEINVGKKSGPT